MTESIQPLGHPCARPQQRLIQGVAVIDQKFHRDCAATLEILQEPLPLLNGMRDLARQGCTLYLKPLRAGCFRHFRQPDHCIQQVVVALFAALGIGSIRHAHATQRTS